MKRTLLLAALLLCTMLPAVAFTGINQGYAGNDTTRSAAIAAGNPDGAGRNSPKSSVFLTESQETDERLISLSAGGYARSEEHV